MITRSPDNDSDDNPTHNPLRLCRHRGESEPPTPKPPTPVPAKKPAKNQAKKKKLKK